MASPKGQFASAYLRSVRNLFSLYCPIVTTWQIYDNSRGGPPLAVALSGPTGEPPVVDLEARAQMQKEGRA